MRIHVSTAAGRTLSSALAGALLLAAAPALAQSGEPASGGAEPKYNIMGPANCAGWPQRGSITSASKAVPLNWALGFVSGRAVQSNIALLDTVDPEAIDQWLTTYCREHPTDSLPAAVVALEGELEARLPKPVQARSDEPPMFFTPPPKPAAASAAKPAAKAKKPAPRKATARAKAKPGG